MAVARGPMRQGGFTLLEMMVVLAIIGILAGGVAFSVSGHSDRRLDMEAERLRDTLQLAADQSVLDGTDMGVALAEGHYAFMKYDIIGQRWRAYDDGPFRRHDLPDGMTLALEVARNQVVLDTGDEVQARPTLLFLSSGERDPFLLTIEDRTHDLSVPMGSDGVSRIELVKAGS